MADDSATHPGATAQDEHQTQIDKQLSTQTGDDPPPTDPPTDPPADPSKREAPPSPRELLLADIEQRRRAELRANGVDLEATPPANPPAADELDPDRQLEAQADVLTLESVKGKKFKHAVDGEEREFNAEDLIRKALKGEAADFRLERATQLLEEARQQAEALRAAGAKTGDEPSPAAKPDDRAADLQAAVKDAMNKLLDGDTDGAAAGLVQFLTPAAAVPQTDEIVNAAIARIKRQEIVTQFYKDYSDVTSADKHLGRMVDEEFGQAVKSLGKEFLTDDELDQQLRAAGERVRKWRDDIAGAPASRDTTQTLDERKRKKDGLDTPRPASTRPTPTAPDAAAATPASRSATVAEIAAARGQRL